VVAAARTQGGLVALALDGEALADEDAARVVALLVDRKRLSIDQ